MLTIVLVVYGFISFFAAAAVIGACIVSGQAGRRIPRPTQAANYRTYPNFDAIHAQVSRPIRRHQPETAYQPTVVDGLPAISAS